MKLSSNVQKQKFHVYCSTHAYAHKYNTCCSVHVASNVLSDSKTFQCENHQRMKHRNTEPLTYFVFKCAASCTLLQLPCSAYVMCSFSWTFTQKKLPGKAGLWSKEAWRCEEQEIGEWGKIVPRSMTNEMFLVNLSARKYSFTPLFFIPLFFTPLFACLQDEIICFTKYNPNKGRGYFVIAMKIESHI